MLDVYGEYNNCLVATVTYDDYVHTDEEIQLKEIFRHPLGYYINVVYDGHYPIWVYNDNKLYALSEAYNNGYLTIDDIKDISVKSYKNLLGHTHNYIDGLCECKEYDVNWLNENFRLSDEQILFNGNVDEDFNYDANLLTLKHSKTYIELSERYFGIDEITKILYISST